MYNLSYAEVFSYFILVGSCTASLVIPYNSPFPWTVLFMKGTVLRHHQISLPQLEVQNSLILWSDLCIQLSVIWVYFAGTVAHTTKLQHGLYFRCTTKCSKTLPCSATGDPRPRITANSVTADTPRLYHTPINQSYTHSSWYWST